MTKLSKMIRFSVLVVGKADIDEACRAQREWKSGLNRWLQVTTDAIWKNPNDVKQTFNPVGRCTAFNIQHNKCRLICIINYDDQTVTVMDILSHVEYDKDRWKNDCGCL